MQSLGEAHRVASRSTTRRSPRGVPRLRVRLLGGRAGGARALGGAVRRLRQRRAGDVDQFIVSGLSKWGQTSRLTLLLPHGYEGNGPEHSSARLERFLQLAAQENIRIATARRPRSTSTCCAARRSTPSARPLVVMTPKGLLRLKQAASTLADLSEGAFRPVLGDPGRSREVRRLVFCSGKLYYDLAGHELREQRRPWRSPGSSSSTRSRSTPRSARALLPAARRSRLGAGGAAEHGRLARDPPPARGVAARGRATALRRPPLAREPFRGLPDRAPERAGPDRAGGDDALNVAAGGCRCSISFAARIGPYLRP